MINSIEHIKKAIILMLGITAFLFIIPVQTNAQENAVLDSVISFKAKNISLYEGLSLIGDKINYEFSYNSDLIATKNEIKVNYDRVIVKDLLDELLNDSTLTYHVTDKQIIIRKKNLIKTLTVINNIQEDVNYLQITGSVLNKTTNESLAYANVALLGKSIGTVTNEEGNFSLKISNKNIVDTVVISFIGFKNTYIPVNQLSIFNNKIYLEEDLFKIKEVVIRVNDPKSILKEAYTKIHENYYTDPYYITSFYREIINNRDKLAAISEAVLQVYKSPYWGLFSDQIKLIKSRKNEYYTQEDTLSLKLKGGLHTSLYLDAIKNPSYFLLEEYFHNYNYSITGIVRFDNHSAYVIKFNPIKYLEDQSFQGNIYINTDDLAIVAIDFSITPEAIDKLGGNLVVKKKFGTRVKATSVKYLINYRRINGKYFINLARGELEFKVKYRRKLFSTNFTTVFEFASNDIDTVDVKRFDRIETISAHNVFIDEEFKYDKDFWGEYNYISPNETLEEALIRIQKSLEDLNQQ